MNLITVQVFTNKILLLILQQSDNNFVLSN